MAISIIDATTDQRARALFLGLPASVYEGDTCYCATPRHAAIADLDRDEFANTQRVLVAEDGGRPVARVVARRSHKLMDDSGRPHGMLGFFEALNHPEAVKDILGAAIGWLRSTGAGSIVGPMNGDTWHSYRFNVGPFEHPPFLMEPYNPPYYPELWERCGFKVLETYYSQRVDDIQALADSLEKKHERALSNGYTMRRLDSGSFLEELEIIHRLSLESFADNFLYPEIPLREFTNMYAGAKRLLDPDLTWFAEAADGGIAGFLFAFPDELKAVASMGGKRSPLALLRFAVARGHADAINIKTAGVARDHRRMGLFAALMFCAVREAIRKGYRATNLCLIKEGNPSGILADSLAEILRRYVLYEYRRLARHVSTRTDTHGRKTMTAVRNPNVVAAFQETVSRVPERTALVIDHGRRTESATFAELWDRVDRVSAGLLRAGFKPGERAILMVPLSVDLYAVLTGVLKMGGVAVFVSPWLSSEHIASSADFAAPSHVRRKYQEPASASETRAPEGDTALGHHGRSPVARPGRARL